MEETNGSHHYNKRDKVYVSNIDYNCSHQDIKDLFQKVGKVAFVEMLKDNNKPNGCAVVRFHDNDMMDKAIDELNRYEYKGRRIVVKDYRDAPVMSAAPLDRYSRDRKRPRDDNHNDFSLMDSANRHGNTFGLSVKFLESLGVVGPLNNRVFVANLPYDATADDLKDLFTICGKVEDVELVQSDDGKSKGFGFVEFDHPIEAVQAISMLNNQPYHERKLTVQYTQSDKRSRNSGSRLPPGLLSIGMGLGVNGSPLRDIARTIKSGQQQSLLGAIPLNSGNIPSLNLGMGLSSDIGRNFANNLSGNIQSNIISPLMQSNLRENLMTGAGLMNNPPALSFRTSRSLNDSPAIGSSLMGPRNCIQVSNLPPDYNWKALYDLCQSFGEVSFAKISSQGNGVVHFESNTAARRAIDMLDRQEFEGRFLEAKLM